MRIVIIITPISTCQLIIWKNYKIFNINKINNLTFNILYINEKYIINKNRNLYIIYMNYDLSELRIIALNYSNINSFFPNQREFDMLTIFDNKILIILFKRNF